MKTNRKAYAKGNELATVEALQGKQDKLIAGDNIIITENTISATQPDISTKQDKLTAGDNITIENNVISASGGGGSGENWADITDQFVPFSNGTTYTGIMLPSSDYSSAFGTVRLTYQSINYEVDGSAYIRAIETITFTLLGAGGAVGTRFFVPFLNVLTDNVYTFEGTIRYGKYGEGLEVAFFMEWDTPIDVFPDWDTDQEYPNSYPEILKIERLIENE